MYYYDGTKWNTFWTTYSNNNTNGTNTLGTTNNEDLRVMTNNIQRINLTEFGSVFINYQEDNNLEFAVGNPSNSAEFTSSINSTVSIGCCANNLIDNNPSTLWAASVNNGSSNLPQWCTYDFGTSDNIVNKYRIETPAVFSSNLTTGPISWEFQGSNDNSNWTTLDSKSDMTYSYNYETNIPNTNAYRYYRLFCTEYHDGGNPMDIGNLKLFGYGENFSPRLMALPW